MNIHPMRRSSRMLVAAVMAILLIGVMPAQAGQPSTSDVQTFSNGTVFASSKMARTGSGISASLQTWGLTHDGSRIGSASGSENGPVTIEFSYYVDAYAANRRETEISCFLRLPQGSDGIEVLRAAVNQGCIRSFRTIGEHGRMMLHCINDVCARVTRSEGIVPDTAWGVDWTGEKGEYWRSGLEEYSASDQDSFGCNLYLVN